MGTFELIKLMLKLKKTAVDIEVGNRTFQLGYLGSFERFFHKDSHPTRDNVSEDKVKEAFEEADKILFYETVNSPRETTWDELAQTANDFFKRK